MTGPLLGEDRPRCSECGGPVDPDVTHVQHDPNCPSTVPRLRADWDWLCECPEVCAACCTDPDCPLRDSQENPR